MDILRALPAGPPRGHHLPRRRVPGQIHRLEETLGREAAAGGRDLPGAVLEGQRDLPRILLQRALALPDAPEERAVSGDGGRDPGRLRLRVPLGGHQRALQCVPHQVRAPEGHPEEGVHNLDPAEHPAGLRDDHLRREVLGNGGRCYRREDEEAEFRAELRRVAEEGVQVRLRETERGGGPAEGQDRGKGQGEQSREL